MSTNKTRLTKNEAIDPEAAMKRDIAAKIAVALNPAKVARAEFTTWYTETIGVAPEWTQPPVNWMFNAWIAAQGEREWLTQEEKDTREGYRQRMLAVMAKRKQSKEDKKLQPEDKEAAAAERKRVSNKETSAP
jgi:hypothetical protein